MATVAASAVAAVITAATSQVLVPLASGHAMMLCWNNCRLSVLLVTALVEQSWRKVEVGCWGWDVCWDHVGFTGGTSDRGGGDGCSGNGGGGDGGGCRAAGSSVLASAVATAAAEVG